MNSTKPSKALLLNFSNAFAKQENNESSASPLILIAFFFV
jgi:hypothetical protein